MNITAAGRLGADPEIKTTRGGKAFVSFSIGCRNGWDKEAKKEKTEWLRCSAFGKTGETISKHCKKGDFIIATSVSMETTKSEKDGQTKYYTNFTVWSMEFGPKATSAGSSSHDQSEVYENVATEDSEPPF